MFTELEESSQETLYVEGASRLLRLERFGDVSELNALMDMLERRVTLLGVLRSALSERDVLVRIGAENDAPALRSLALVAAGYGLPAAPPRDGVGDRAAADGLRPRDPRRARGGRSSSRASWRTCMTSARDVPRDPLRGARRHARGAARARSRRRFGGWRASCTPTSTATIPRPRTSSRRPPRPTRSSPTPSAGRPTTATATRVCAAAATRPNFEGFGSVADIFEAFFGGGSVRRRVRRRRGARRADRRAATSPSRPRSTWPQAAHGASVEVEYEVIARCEHCHGNGAEPGTPIETCPRCGGSGQLRAVSRTPFGQVVRAAACDVCHGDGRVAKEPCHVCQGRGRKVERAKVAVDVPAGIADGQRIRIGGRGHAGERGGPPGDLYVLVRVREDPRFVRDGDDLVTAVDVAAPLAALGTTVEVPTVDGPVELEIPAGTQPHETLVIRGAGDARAARPPHRRPAGGRQRRHPPAPEPRAARAARAARRRR